MVTTKVKLCMWSDCITVPYYNYPTCIKAIYCEEHKADEMVNIISEKCQQCGIRASFNYKGFKNSIYCEEHAISGMINIRTTTICQKCEKSASYNYKGLKAIFCKDCKDPEMINVRKKCCVKCDTTPSFNFIGIKPAKYCDDHKEPTMVNVNSKLCQHKNCIHVATCNFKGKKGCIYCSEHAEKGMINRSYPICNHPGCPKTSTFGHDKKVSHCKKHATKDMIKIGGKRCLQPGCPKHPTYNYPTELLRIYCAEHMKSGMVSVRKKTCIEEKCTESPTFGLITDNKPTKCYDHKDTNMIRLDKKSACSIKDCDREYSHEYNDKKFCRKHIEEDGKILTAKGLCKYHDLAYESTFVCSDCKSHLRKKEWEVVCTLKRRIPEEFLYDSYTVAGECSRRRPDIFYDLKSHIVIIEVDEHQHKRYNTDDSCECARMNEIIASFAGTPVVFIRYNPDTINGKYGKIDVPKEKRLKNLVDIVELIISEVPETYSVKLLQLYFDDDYEVYEEFKEEDITGIVADPTILKSITYGFRRYLK